MTNFTSNNASTVMEILTLGNIYTGGIFWVVTIFILGFIVFITLKVNDINNSLILSTFLMSFLSILLNFIGLVNVYFLGIFFALFVLSLILKVVMR